MNPLLLMAATGRTFDQSMMKEYFEKSATRRRWIFARLADLLFGIIMIFWGQLDLKVKRSDGTIVDATDASVKPEEKLNALIEGMKAGQKGQLLREFLRPLLVTGAELLAELMTPDPMMLTLFANAGAAPQAPATNVIIPPPPTTSTAEAPPVTVSRLAIPRSSLQAALRRAQATEIDLGNGVIVQLG